LLEMIEAQRKTERERSEKKRRPRSLGRKRNKQERKHRIADTDGASISFSEVDVSDVGEISDNEDVDHRRDSNTTPSPGSPRKYSLSSNGHADPSVYQSDGKNAIMHLDRHQLVQAGPYLSAMSVVLIGVAVMALVNKMSRGEH